MAAIVRVDPLLPEFERMLGDIWTPWTQVTSAAGMPLDIRETKDELVITVDLPGVKREDVQITLEEETLRLDAEKKEEKAQDGESWYARERSFGKYARVMGLPFRVAAERITAIMENGVLEVRLPKAEEAKPKRIEIKPK